MAVLFQHNKVQISNEVSKMKGLRKPFIYKYAVHGIARDKRIIKIELREALLLYHTKFYSSMHGK